MLKHPGTLESKSVLFRVNSGEISKIVPGTERMEDQFAIVE